MKLGRRGRRLAGVTAATTAAAVLGVAAAAPAHADVTAQIGGSINGSIHAKTLGLDLPFSNGSLSANANLSNNTVTGSITLPQLRKTISVPLLGLPLATAVINVTQAKPVAGTIVISQNSSISATATENIQLTSLSILGLPINLVGNSCKTKSPASIPLSGPLDLTAPFTVNGTFTIGNFANCGFLTTPLVNLLLPASGNTITATITPSLGGSTS